MPTRPQAYAMLTVVLFAVGGAGIATLGSDAPDDPSNESAHSETPTVTPGTPNPETTPTGTPVAEVSTGTVTATPDPTRTPTQGSDEDDTHHGSRSDRGNEDTPTSGADISINITVK